MSSRRAALASALVEAGPAGVSGEVLAARLGVSRVAVAKHIAALRELGYDIGAVRGEGYRLSSVPESVVPPEVERLVADPMWVRFEGTRETASTNDDCKVLARAGAPEGTVVLARRQTAGRGRMGRTWISPEGGVYLSAVLRPRVAPTDAAPLALVVALGVANGLEAVGVKASLKWPNDVQFDGRKIAGVLLEMSAEADQVDWMVAGCGINVHPSHDALAGVAFADEAARCRPAEVAAAVLDGIAAVYRTFETSGFSALVARYQERHALTGTGVTVRDMAGGLVASGRVVGVDEAGGLLLDNAGVVARVTAGEVTLGLPPGVDAQASSG
ncbi:MAG: biotin--[acetyl-CoA-carboxylase] ligase [Coriobacteriia bacterium]